MSAVLAFDTATAATVAGLAVGDSVLTRRDDPAPGARPNHAERLLALCEELLAEAGTGWDAVARIGVGVGPGTFTGLRIGVATGRALAQATGAELVAVATLEALAAGARRAGERDAILALLDARRGEVFAAAWAADATRLVEPAAIAPERIGDLAGVAAGPWQAVGDGAVRHRGHAEAAGVRVRPDDSPLHRVDGAALCALALRAAPADPGTLVPDYLRLPDAEIARRRQAASS